MKIVKVILIILLVGILYPKIAFHDHALVTKVEREEIVSWVWTTHDHPLQRLLLWGSKIQIADKQILKHERGYTLFRFQVKIYTIFGFLFEENTYCPDQEFLNFNCGK
jgi:hypothetical protein